MMNGSEPYNPSGGDRASGPMRTGCVRRAFPSPSPWPSPLGRGRIAARLSANPARFDLPKHWERFPLSPRERVGVRGKETLAVRAPSASDLRPDPRPKGRMPLSH